MFLPVKISNVRPADGFTTMELENSFLKSRTSYYCSNNHGWNNCISSNGKSCDENLNKNKRKILC